MTTEEFFKKRRQELTDAAKARGIDMSGAHNHLPPDDDGANVAALATLLGYDVRSVFDRTTTPEQLQRQAAELARFEEKRGHERAARNRSAGRF